MHRERLEPGGVCLYELNIIEQVPFDYWHIKEWLHIQHKTKYSFCFVLDRKPFNVSSFLTYAINFYDLSFNYICVAFEVHNDCFAACDTSKAVSLATRPVAYRLCTALYADHHN